jgi:hypothetical protein
MKMPTHDSAQIIATTRAWIERAVIGLNLCPFAKPVFVNDLIRYAVSAARDEDALLDDLRDELQRLATTPPNDIETTLLIHPLVFADFFEFNDFLDAADALVAALGYDGVLQIASFHPRYQFAGAAASDVTNATNRSPYPMLHVLREASVERALANFPSPASIYENNLRTLTQLGDDGWERLQAQYLNDAQR